MFINEFVIALCLALGLRVIEESTVGLHLLPKQAEALRFLGLDSVTLIAPRSCSTTMGSLNSTTFFVLSHVQSAYYQWKVGRMR